MEGLQRTFERHLHDGRLPQQHHQRDRRAEEDGCGQQLDLATPAGQLNDHRDDRQQGDQGQPVEHPLHHHRRERKALAHVPLAAQQVGSPELAQAPRQQVVRGKAHDQHRKQGAEWCARRAAEDQPPAHRSQPVADQRAHGRWK